MTNSADLPNTAQLQKLRAKLDRPIVLVGMMGVGKSSVGRRLAQALDLGFADADEEIVEAAQMPITDIFDEFGEDYFRNGERRVITRLLESSDHVISTGGGAFVQEETRALILEHGIPIWLDSDIDTLVERVSRNDKRPLLRGGNIREIVTKMRSEREPAYSQAPIHVTSNNGPHNVVVTKILEALDQWL